MTKNDLLDSLSAAYPPELSDSLVTAYNNSLTEYRKLKWQYCGNEIGQFVEICRRIIEYQVFGTFTPLSARIAPFSEKTLAEIENHDAIVPESYRIIIPRVLYSMYCLRNKRGMIHKNNIDPNKMDATLLIANMKWVMAELFRLASALPFDEAESLIDSIMSRESPLIWDTGSSLRVLKNGMPVEEKVLCLLCFRDGQSVWELRNAVEYQNASRFSAILKDLHRGRWIELSGDKCRISPLGEARAEAILEKHSV